MTNYDILKEYEAHQTPVPSYDEWQQLKKFCEEFNALNVSKENEQLKELLKECENSILYYQETYGAMDLDTYTLLAKLKEVLK